MAKHPPSKDESAIWLIQQSDEDEPWKLTTLGYYRHKSSARRRAATEDEVFSRLLPSTHPHHGRRHRVIEYRAVEG